MGRRSLRRRCAQPPHWSPSCMSTTRLAWFSLSTRSARSAASTRPSFTPTLPKCDSCTHLFASQHHVQALGKVPINVNASNIDAMSMSGHKIYGPKGLSLPHQILHHIDTLLQASERCTYVAGRACASSPSRAVGDRSGAWYQPSTAFCIDHNPTAADCEAARCRHPWWSVSAPHALWPKLRLR